MQLSGLLQLSYQTHLHNHFTNKEIKSLKITLEEKEIKSLKITLEEMSVT